MILLTIGAVSLIALVGQHRWRVPRWLSPLLLFTGVGGILAGMGVFTLALLVG
ncbi:hypothetical protein [Roseospira visakhapatnamensis]|uniref:Uncharacterized protein n=1 Tax=Roseospira visakhapatnamensis TaxID=390880 RepID=A0A7W6RAK0_9PROT|nr:hypothetical protein [Roseospira visakhapatnamensis]MBB4264922.1 hypothetical protein [Roseospira visakhapatnamensis]